MKILMSLQDHYYPDDPRVLYEARTLIGAGHEVFLLCRNKPGGLDREIVDGMTVFRVNLPKNYLFYVWNITCFSAYNPIWKKALSRIIEQERIEALHIHDLQRVVTGISVARKFNIPVVADLHENYPSAIKIYSSYLEWYKRIILRVINPVWLWKLIESYSVNKSSKVITICDEAMEHYIKEYGCKDKIIFLQNVPDLSHFSSFTVDNNIKEKYKDYFILSYIGIFGPHRGVRTIISAMPTIVKEIPNARLLLVGGKEDKDKHKLIEQVESLHMEDFIEFTGQQPFSLIPSYNFISDICIIPASGYSLQTNASSPHKLFQSMAIGKPVIVASMKSLSRVIKDTDAGLIYTADDSSSLADAVILLYKDNDLRHRMGENARNAVINKYNWDNEGKKLIDLYKELE